MANTEYFRAMLEDKPATVADQFSAAGRWLVQAGTGLVLGDRSEIGRRMIYLLGAFLVTVVSIEGLVFGVAPYAQASLYWSSLASAFGLLGTFWKRPEVVRVAVFGLGSCIMLSLHPFVGHSASTTILASISLVSFWTSLFLPIYLNLVIWLLAALCIYLGGGYLTTNTLYTQAPNEFPVMAVITYMVVPWAIGALLRRDESSRHRVMQRSIRGLSGEREELRLAYAQKAQELDDSRQALVEAERHQTTGRIASGLAHELNNILTPIHGLAELLVQNPHSARTERYAQSILHSAQSASMMTQALLTYTRQGQFDPLILDSSQIFSQLLLPELKTQIPPKIQLHTDVQPGLLLNVDRRLLLQSAWHLLRNAVDAMPEGGVLLLSLQPYAAAAPQPGPCAKDPQWARLTVSDTGEGIPPENLSRVFDPFFTTKTFGVGAGLGLALVHGAITQHGGKVSIESELGRGTSIHLDLPIVQGQAAELDEDPTSLYMPTKAAILVASPDIDLRDELEEVLAERGFAVDSLQSADELLAELAPRHAPTSSSRWEGRSWIIDAKLMPQGPAPELCELMQERQGPRILVLTAPDTWAQWQSLEPNDRVRFAQKPLHAQSLDDFLQDPENQA